jgi:nucleoside-diphosphate-sugar epimerase
VVFDFSYESVRQRWKDPGARANTSWAYIDGRDAASACRLAIEAEFAGHEVMIVAAPTSSMREPTVELIEKYLGQGIAVRTTGAGNWSGVSSAKAEKMLGFKARYGWENLVQV